MNTSIIKNLIVKDLQLNIKPQLLFLGLGLIGVWLLTLEQKGAFYTGMVIMLSMVILSSAFLTITSITTERKDKNLPFILSLPVTFMQYTHAKIITNLGIFMVFWGLILAGLLFVIFSQETIPDGITVFAVILMLEMLLVFVLLLAVALISESQSWTTAVMTLTNIGLSLFMFWMSSIPAIKAHMDGPEVVWNRTAISIVVVELLLIVFLLLLTYTIQARKKDFL